MNPDSSATDVLFQVDVAASSSDLLHNTGACFNDLGSDRGLYIYVRLSSPHIIKLLFISWSSGYQEYYQHGLPGA
jgi:hypothetical protein